jgi:inhibitor of KinA sporulation pathway (predicted exonuclease)
MNVHGKRLIKTGVNHNALDDARSEAKLLIELLRPEQSILNGRMV